MAATPDGSCGWRTYSMTSSARSRIDCGTVRPSAGGLEVDDELELRGLLHGHIGRPLTLKNTPGINAGESICF
jgi:hypothetical protein